MSSNVGLFSTLWGYVPSLPLWVTARQPTPIQQIAEEHILPRVIVSGMPLFRIEHLSTQNSVSELLDAIASKMECSAHKIHILINGKTIDCSSAPKVLSGTIEKAIDGVKLLQVQKDKD